MRHLVLELEEAVEGWDRLGWPRPVAALVTGSGHAFDFDMPVRGRAPFDAFFPGTVDKIAGHSLEVQLLEPEPGRYVVAWRGRLHAYQGYTPAEVVFAVRLSILLGVHTVLLTNASGGLDPELQPGQIVALTDHINGTGQNPLTGTPPAEWGPRFPDMTDAYDPLLRARIHEIAEDLEIPVTDGIYAAVAGPSYETPAEVRMLAAAGGTLVGMSTVLEVIAARHLGARCGALSLVANAGAGYDGAILDHDDVLASGKAAADVLCRLLTSLLRDPRFLSR